MIGTILYIENYYKARFSDLKKCVENDYVLNKAEYPQTITVVKYLLLNYHPNYSMQYQYQGDGNQLMFT